MPSWKGVMSDAQASAIAAYVLAGFPHVGPEIDFNVAKASDIYSAYACIVCHGQVGAKASPAPAPTRRCQRRCLQLRNPGDTASVAEMLGLHHERVGHCARQEGRAAHAGLGPDPLTQQVKALLPYIQDGPKARQLPPPPSPEPLLSPAAAPSPAGSP